MVVSDGANILFHFNIVRR